MLNPITPGLVDERSPLVGGVLTNFLIMFVSLGYSLGIYRNGLEVPGHTLDSRVVKWSLEWFGGSKMV